MFKQSSQPTSIEEPDSPPTGGRSMLNPRKLVENAVILATNHRDNHYLAYSYYKTALKRAHLCNYNDIIPFIKTNLAITCYNFASEVIRDAEFYSHFGHTEKEVNSLKLVDYSHSISLLREAREYAPETNPLYGYSIDKLATCLIYRSYIYCNMAAPGDRDANEYYKLAINDTTEAKNCNHEKYHHHLLSTLETAGSHNLRLGYHYTTNRIEQNFTIAEEYYTKSLEYYDEALTINHYPKNSPGYQHLKESVSHAHQVVAEYYLSTNRPYDALTHFIESHRCLNHLKSDMLMWQRLEAINQRIEQLSTDITVIRPSHTARIISQSASQQSFRQ